MRSFHSTPEISLWQLHKERILSFLKELLNAWSLVFSPGFTTKHDPNLFRGLWCESFDDHWEE